MYRKYGQVAYHKYSIKLFPSNKLNPQETFRVLRQQFIFCFVTARFRTQTTVELRKLNPT